MSVTIAAYRFVQRQDFVAAAGQIAHRADEFFEVLGRHKQARAVIWGHVHQEMIGRRNGLALFGTPSTCAQFLPTSELFRLDTAPPAYRWLELYPDGEIRSEVEWVISEEMV